MSAPHSGIDLSAGLSGGRAAAMRGGYVRVAFALAGLFLAFTLFAEQPYAVTAFAVYFAVTAFEQWLLATELWRSRTRTFVGGCVDILAVTYSAYLLGPSTTPVAFLYLLLPVMIAASTSARTNVAMPLAVTGAVLYAMLLVATSAGYIPYGPASATPLPNAVYQLGAGLVVIASVIVTTSIVLRQIVALDRANQLLHELSIHDELTGLPNRRQLMLELSRQLARVRRGASFALVMLDLDGFKRVNDTYGHEAGDRLLVALAQALDAETRDIDLVARVGGDEFVVILPDVDADSAAPIAERMVHAIHRASRETYPDCRVTASAGLAFAAIADEPGDLLRRADAEAYAAKRAGGDRVRAGERRSASGVVPALTPADFTRRRDG